MSYSSGPGGVIPHPQPEVNFLMVEIPTPKPYILWSGWIDKLNAPRVEARGHPHLLPEVFLRITHISKTILSILTKLCSNVPLVILFQCYVRYVWGPRGGLKWLIIIIFKNLLLVNQQCQKIDTVQLTAYTDKCWA
jgi:hypothetical protein